MFNVQYQIHMRTTARSEAAEPVKHDLMSTISIVMHLNVMWV
jgi:hypothetical protein